MNKEKNNIYNNYRVIFTVLLFTITFFNCTDKKSTVNDVIEVVDFKGLEHYLHSNDDKVHIVNFWAMWCVPCVKELPYLQKFTNDNDDVDLLLVSLDFSNEIESKLKPFLQDHDIIDEVIIMDDPDSNYWIDQIDPNWSGAIPFTIIFKNDIYYYYERSFESVSDLENEINKFN